MSKPKGKLGNEPTYQTTVDVTPRPKYARCLPEYSYTPKYPPEAIPIILPPIWNDDDIQEENWFTSEEPYSEAEKVSLPNCSAVVDGLKWLRVYDLTTELIKTDCQLNNMPEPEKREETIEDPNSKKKGDKPITITIDPFLPEIIAKPTPNMPPSPEGYITHRKLIYPLKYNQNSKEPLIMSSLIEYLSQFPDRIPKGSYLWESIYPKDDQGCPIYNPGGKYIVKIFMCGYFRKIIIDDIFPVDSDGIPLLVYSSHINEIWPLIIHKCILKIRSFFPPNPNLSDPWILHYLSGGWLPQYISQGGYFWDYLKLSTPIVISPLEMLTDIQISEQSNVPNTKKETKSTKLPPKKQPPKPNPKADKKGKDLPVIESPLKYEITTRDYIISGPLYTVALTCSKTDEDRGLVEGRLYPLKDIRLSQLGEKELQVTYPIVNPLNKPYTPQLYESLWIPLLESQELFDIRVVIYDTPLKHKYSVNFHYHWQWNDDENMILSSKSEYGQMLRSNLPVYFTMPIITIHVNHDNGYDVPVNEPIYVPKLETSLPAELEGENHLDTESSVQDLGANKNPQIEINEPMENTGDPNITPTNDNNNNIRSSVYTKQIIYQVQIDPVPIIFKTEPNNLSMRLLPESFSESINDLPVKNNILTDNISSINEDFNDGKYSYFMTSNNITGYSFNIYSDYLVEVSDYITYMANKYKLKSYNFKGLSPDIQDTVWKIWLWKNIRLKQETTIQIILHLWCKESHEGNHIILLNSFTGETLQIDSLISSPITLPFNDYGYSLLIYSYDKTNVIPSSQYDLTILSNVDFQSIEDIPMGYNLYTGGLYIPNKYYILQEDILTVSSMDFSLKYIFIDSSIHGKLQIIDPDQSDRPILREYDGLGEIIVWNLPPKTKPIDTKDKNKKVGDNILYTLKLIVDIDKCPYLLDKMKSNWPFYYTTREEIESQPKIPAEPPSKTKAPPAKGQPIEEEVQIPTDGYVWTLEIYSSKPVSLTRDTYLHTKQKQLIHKWFENDGFRVPNGSEIRDILTKSELSETVPSFVTDNDKQILAKIFQVHSQLTECQLETKETEEKNNYSYTDMDSYDDVIKGNIEEERHTFNEISEKHQADIITKREKIKASLDEFNDKRKELSGKLQCFYVKFDEFRSSKLQNDTKKEKIFEELNKNAGKGKKPPPKKK